LRVIALVIFLAAPLLFLLLLLLFVLLSLTVRALTLAELSLVSFVTHIEFSFAHQINRAFKMRLERAMFAALLTISQAARQLLCIHGPILTKKTKQCCGATLKQ
jgi:hypothetical protein